MSDASGHRLSRGGAAAAVAAAAAAAGGSAARPSGQKAGQKHDLLKQATSNQAKKAKVGAHSWCFGFWCTASLAAYNKHGLPLQNEATSNRAKTAEAVQRACMQAR